MKIIVAGQDRTTDLGEGVRADAEARRDAAPFRAYSPQHSALTLRETGSEAEFLDRFRGLMALRHGLNLNPRPRPIPWTPAGRLVWRVKQKIKSWLTMEHPRLVVQQSAINELTIAAIELEHAAVVQELARLRARVSQLEKAAGKPGATPEGGAS